MTTTVAASTDKAIDKRRALGRGLDSVSYTHLDVYKRQGLRTNISAVLTSPWMARTKGSSFVGKGVDPSGK